MGLLKVPLALSLWYIHDAKKEVGLELEFAYLRWLSMATFLLHSIPARYIFCPCIPTRVCEWERALVKAGTSAYFLSGNLSEVNKQTSLECEDVNSRKIQLSVLHNLALPNLNFFIVGWNWRRVFKFLFILFGSNWSPLNYFSFD